MTRQEKINEVFKNKELTILEKKNAFKIGDAFANLQASNEAEKILLHLENGGNFEGAEEPLRIYLACFQALKKIKDPRSATVLQDAVRLLETQVSKLHDAQAREMFIQNVPCRRDIQEAWNASQKE